MRGRGEGRGKGEGERNKERAKTQKEREGVRARERPNSTHRLPKRKPLTEGRRSARGIPHAPKKGQLAPALFGAGGGGGGGGRAGVQGPQVSRMLRVSGWTRQALLLHLGGDGAESILAKRTASILYLFCFMLSPASRGLEAAVLRLPNMMSCRGKILPCCTKARDSGNKCGGGFLGPGC